MSRLLRLYPAAWRERYEPELLVLLRERPIGVGGRIDMVRGAIDAHLHPELIGAAWQPWTHRLPGLLAATGGLIWSWFWVRVYLMPSDEEWGNAIGWAFMLMLIAVPGDYWAGYGRRIALAFGTVVVLFAIARFFPWSASDGAVNVALGGAAYVVIGSGWLTLAAIRAGLGRSVRWLLAVATVVVPALIATIVLGGFGPTDPGGRTALLVAVLPYGFAWTLVGLRMTIRGSATIRDTPPDAHAPEVLAT